MKRLSGLFEGETHVGAALRTDLIIKGLTADHRSVVPGGLFFAIRGTSMDGHSLITEALQRGAAGAVVDKPEYFSQNTILVPNCRKAFAEASAAWFSFPSRDFKLVGITGTNGKTTSAYLLEQVWSGLGKVSGLIGTVETKIGSEAEVSNMTTPGPYDLQQVFDRMRTATVSHVAMEVTSIALDQFRTVGSQFDVALFTNFTQDHLDYHGSMENYLQAKAKLFRDFPLNTLVMNVEDPVSEKLALMARGNIIFYGRNPKASFRLVSYETTERGSTAKIQTPEGPVNLTTPHLGLHNIYNCLGVLGVGYAQGFKVSEMAHVLETAKGAPGRLERVLFKGDLPNVFVDYAHSEDALKNVLSVLDAFRTKGENRIITVFGCGGDRDRSKRPEMAKTVSSFSDVTVVTSDNPRTEDPNRIIDEIEVGIDRNRTQYFRDADRRRAIHKALSLAKANDLVLIAGKGHETYQIVGREKAPFDDREEVRRYFSR